MTTILLAILYIFSLAYIIFLHHHIAIKEDLIKKQKDLIEHYRKYSGGDPIDWFAKSHYRKDENK